MLTDAHCHPADLIERFPAAEEQRRQLGVLCAASATTAEEFAYCERLSRAARDNSAAPLLPCFAVHPQMPAVSQLSIFNEQLAMLNALAAQGRLTAIGETGFDLFNAAYRETEKIQDDLFAAHLETALRHDLPLVIHARRAMHKIFAHSSALKKCRAVVFHSWSGTVGEGGGLLRRGINAFFSFGNVIMLNHREAMRCCAVFPANRLLTETDAPFQPPRGKEFSTYADITRILEAAAALRREAGTEGSSVQELEMIIEQNFYAAFKGSKNFIS
jgi:TatD DNase family protein